MFEIKANGPNRVDVDFSGKLDAREMKTALAELEEKSRGIKGGIMLYRIHDFQLPTAGAIGVEILRLPVLFKLVRRFDRAAVVAERKWIRKLAEWEGKLLPGFEIKGFEIGEEDKAEAWLAGTSSQ